LGSFLFILWGLSGAITLPVGGGIAVPGYLVWVALLYAAAGTWLAHRIGRPLVGLNFTRQRAEADFRFSLVRFRENTESIALYAGEDDEKRGFMQRFAAVADNWWDIMRRQKKLMWFQSFYGQLAIIFPYAVVAPRYFSGAIALGGLMQTASAFEQVQNSLSWFIDAYVRLADWKATVDRLIGFRRVMDSAARIAVEAPGVQRVNEPRADIVTEDMKLALPTGRVLLDDVDLALVPGESTLVTGPSGSGKSTLFRALAGIWPFGSGAVRWPERARILFLPQRPYLPIGTLRQVLSYPAAAGAFDDAQLADAVDRCGLGHLRERLDESQHWALMLSGGEQQRVGFVRAWLHQPQWLFLDEASSALDEPSERQLYELMHSMTGTTLVSIGHRAGLVALHRRRLAVMQGPAGAGRLVEVNG
jgi:putative ATP-binding cassette transporter